METWIIFDEINGFSGLSSSQIVKFGGVEILQAMMDGKQNLRRVGWEQSMEIVWCGPLGYEALLNRCITKSWEPIKLHHCQLRINLTTSRWFYSPENVGQVPAASFCTWLHIESSEQFTPVCVDRGQPVPISRKDSHPMWKRLYFRTGSGMYSKFNDIESQWLDFSCIKADFSGLCSPRVIIIEGPHFCFLRSSNGDAHKFCMNDM